MFFSLALILLAGLSLGWICKKIGLPPLIGMIAAGILIGPYGLNFLDANTLAIGADLRKIALLVILTRAGLNLNLDDLKKCSVPAILMAFVPATCEIIGTVILAPMILHITWIEAAVLGSVIAAVSPAVVVPRMIKLIEQGYGTRQAVPQMILAGSSLDDIYVIVLFSVFSSMAAGGSFQPAMLLDIPVSIVLGLAGGAACGWTLGWFYSKISLRKEICAIQFYAITFLLVAIENALTDKVPFSSLLAVMTFAFILKRQAPETAAEIKKTSDAIWVLAEIFLFVLVGAVVNVSYAFGCGLQAVALLALVLVFRMAGVWLCVRFAPMDAKSRLFCMIAYTPKATVQAAIGAIPLSMGLACGQTVLTLAVLSILLTAPLGAFAIDHLYPRLLTKDER